MEDQAPGAAAEGSVRVGAYSLEVGRLGSFARFEPGEERKNARDLAAALEQEPDDRPAVVAAVEDFQESADAVTSRIERADKLLRDAAGGKLLDLGNVSGEVDALLDLCARLDSEGRFDEELRLMRSLNGLLALSLRWLDLIRSLWSLLRSAEAAGHAPAQAFAHHELGSLKLCAGRPGEAVDHLERASRIERQLGDIAGSCATRHNLDSARRDLALRSGRWFRRPGRAQRLVVLAGAIAIAGGSGAGIALAIHGRHHTTTSTHDVTVQIAGKGTGSVRGDGIDCPGDCEATVDAGARLRLGAIAGARSRFVRWEGANCARAVCPLIVGRDRTPTAIFEPRVGDTKPPTTPTGLSAKAASPGEIDLAWSPSRDNVGVTGYVIYRDGSKLTTVTGATTSYRDTSNLAASTEYAYTVQAIDAAGNRSARSGEATARTTAAGDKEPPSVPTGLQAAAVSTSEIDLSWTASIDNVAVTEYVVYRNGIEVARVSGDTTTYPDTGLTESTTYTYTVKALDRAGNISGTSDSATATTQSIVE